jgi:hypothetical protein
MVHLQPLRTYFTSIDKVTGIWVFGPAFKEQQQEKDNQIKSDNPVSPLFTQTLLTVQ